MNRVLLVAVMFALFVVTLGAYTRLTNAGLGCPDWPGCYGHMVLPSENLHHAQAAYPEIPIEKTKAWTEMAHRYVAGTLGLFIVGFAGFAIRAYFKGRHYFPYTISFCLVGLVIFQALLGMWTVTLKLLPVVVMGHLLGGMSILGCLWWCFLATRSSKPRRPYFKLESYRKWVVLGIVIVFCQIALGGWVSSNYAGLSCIGLPGCNGQWFPALSLSDAFNFNAPIGENYQGGLLSSGARMTIQYVHRIGALVTTLYVLALAIMLFRVGRRQLRQAAMATCLVLLIQLLLGAMNVIKLLPLDIAVAHNGVGALLLLSMIALYDGVKFKGTVDVS